MLLILLVLILIGLFYCYAIKPLSFWKNKGVKQTKPLWLFGDSFSQIIRKISFTEMLQNVYDTDTAARYIGFYQFTFPILMLRDPKLIKQITVEEFDHFMDHRQFLPPQADPLWGRNLLSLQGQQWKEMRPILSPSFTSNKLKMMFTLMNESAESFLNFYLQQKNQHLEVEMKDVTARYCNDVIASTSFGYTIDSLRNPNNDFYLMAKDISNFSEFLKFITLRIFEDPSRSFFTNLVERNLKSREEKGIIRNDMIHLLMEAKIGLQDKEESSVGLTTQNKVVLGNGADKVALTNTDIVAQALVFFLAGFESVSTLITMMGYELAINPDIQSRLRNEIESSFEHCNGKLTYYVLIKMKYLDMVTSETLRKWPSIPATDRVCTKESNVIPELPNEVPLQIKKGTVVQLPIMAMHHDHKHFPNPDRFDPERFSDENKGSIDPYSYFPFGLGPRNCIGSRYALIEAKILISHILLHYEIIPTSRTIIPLQLSKKHINVYPEHNVNLGFKRIMK